MTRVYSSIMPINLDGILLPVTTTFTSAEDFDREAFTTNLMKWNDTGVIGYVVLGSTGERVNLNQSEYLQVIAVARRTVPETMSFIVGAGQQSTRATIDEIQSAANAGAEALLVITPHYYRSAITHEALVSHYTAVADVSPVPIILYSMPDLTGVKIEPETAARLSEHQNIIGIKDSSADVAKLAETVRLVPEDFSVMIGNGTVLCEALQAGGRGGILAVACVAPELCLEIYRAVRAGEIDRANRLQEKLSPLARAVTKTYGIGGLKMAMEMVGFAGGVVRAPLQWPGETAAAEIARLISEATDFGEVARASRP